MDEEISVQIEANEALKKINPLENPGKLETVCCIPRKVSRKVLFFIGEEGGWVDGAVLPTCCHPLSNSSGGLEIPLIMIFRSIRYNTHQKLEDFMTTLYCYDQEPDTVESDSDDEIHKNIRQHSCGGER